MPQFDSSFYLGQLFWLALCFAALLGYMTYVGRARLGKPFYQRDRKQKQIDQKINYVQAEIEGHAKKQQHVINRIYNNGRQLLQQEEANIAKAKAQQCQELRQAHEAALAHKRTELQEVNKSTLINDNAGQAVPILLKACLPAKLAPVAEKMGKSKKE